MPKALPKITTAEWEIMEILWRQSPLRFGEIAEAAGQHPKTVQTYVNRLVKKGAIAAEKSGNAFLYKPALEKTECQAAEGRDFLDRVFGGALQPMLAHFVSQENLTAEEIGELEKILKQRRKK